MVYHTNWSVTMDHNLLLESLRHYVPHIIPLVMVWLRDTSRPSKACIIVVLGGHFCTRWQMSFSIKETLHTPQQTRLLPNCFRRESLEHTSPWWNPVYKLKAYHEKKQVASKLYRDELHPKGRTFDLYQSVQVENTRGGCTIVVVNGPETYLSCSR